MPKFEGLIAAPFTAMHDDGSLDLTQIEHQARGLLEAGVKGAFVCGTTGEGLSLTSDERRSVVEAWSSATPRDFAVIVHVGHPSLGEAQALAQHAASVGVDGVAAMPSSPFASPVVDDVVDHARQVASAAPSVPFFYYHVPSVSRTSISMYEFLAAAAPRIPNLAGVKFTYEDLMDYSRCVRFDGGRFDLLFGRDEIFLAGLACGARSAVGSTYNFAAPLFHAIMDSFAAGNLQRARDLQLGLQHVVSLLPDLRSQKHAAARAAGISLGPTRAPLRRLSAEAARALDHELDAAGFAAVCAGAPTGAEA